MRHEISQQFSMLTLRSSVIHRTAKLINFVKRRHKCLNYSRYLDILACQNSVGPKQTIVLIRQLPIQSMSYSADPDRLHLLLILIRAHLIFSITKTCLYNF